MDNINARPLEGLKRSAVESHPASSSYLPVLQHHRAKALS